MNGILIIRMLLRTIFISVEALVTLLAFLLYQLRLSVIRQFGEFIYSDNTVVTFFTVAVPVGVFLYSLSLQKALLQPEANNKILIKWQDYKNYKITTYIGLLFCASPIPPSIVAWVAHGSYDTYDLGFYYLWLLAVSLVSVTSMYAAQFKVKEILDEHSGED